ncbi:MAG: hypothetical protein QXS00_07935 [Pyrobaculum sp.]
MKEAAQRDASSNESPIGIVILFFIAFGMVYAFFFIDVYLFRCKPPGSCPKIFFTDEQCDQDGCAVTVNISAPRGMFVFVGDTALELKGGDNFEKFYVRWGSALNITTDCYTVVYEPRRRASNATAGLTD